MPGTSITLLAPGFRGALTQRAPGVAHRDECDLPFAEAASGADVMLAAQLQLELDAQPVTRASGLRSRSALIMHPLVIVPRRSGVTYAMLQTDETGTSSFVFPEPGDEHEAVFPLSVAAQDSTRRTLRVLVWPDQGPGEPDAYALAGRWERVRRPYQLAQRGPHGLWQPPDRRALARGRVLILLHDTFSTPQSAFVDWLSHDSFDAVARAYEGRCLAFAHPTLSARLDANVEWLVDALAGLPGPFDVVAHGRGGLLARALAHDGRLRLGRVCQVGTPNLGTPLATADRLRLFLDAHVAMLARAKKALAQATLEGALCLARAAARGVRGPLPGLDELTPEAAARFPREGAHHRDTSWFTVGAQYSLPGSHLAANGGANTFFGSTNDLVVPSAGCHAPGFPVTDSLHLSGVHHHGYFCAARVRERIAAWLM